MRQQKDLDPSQRDFKSDEMTKLPPFGGFDWCSGVKEATVSREIVLCRFEVIYPLA